MKSLKFWITAHPNTDGKRMYSEIRDLGIEPEESGGGPRCCGSKLDVYNLKDSVLAVVSGEDCVYSGTVIGDDASIARTVNQFGLEEYVVEDGKK